MKRRRLPKLALAYDLYIGPLPSFLDEQTIVEQSVVARCFIKATIIKINTHSLNSNLYAQSKIRGNIITFPQNPDNLLTILPNIPSGQYIQIAFVGNCRPDPTKVHKLFRVRRSLIQTALLWFKKHNSFYKDVIIDKNLLNKLPTDDVPKEIEESFTYINTVESSNESVGYDNLNREEDLENIDNDVTFKYTGIFNSEDALDLPVLDKINMLKETYVQKTGNTINLNNQKFISLKHGNIPVNEINNPDHLKGSFPTLWPYGIGGICEQRKIKLTFREHVEYLLRLDSNNFRCHPSFIFIVGFFIR